MKKFKLQYRYLMYSFTFLVLLFACKSSFSAQPFKLYAVSDLVRVFEDGYNLTSIHDTMKVFGIRGEIISGQCVVQAQKDLTNLRLDIGELKNLSSGNIFASSDVAWDFVGTIPLKTNARNQPKEALTRSAPANYPDYLKSEKQLSINKGTYQSVWFTITIPEDAEADTYTGEITVKTDQGDKLLPVELTIYPVLLPAKRNLKVAEWYSTRNFKKIHGIDQQYSESWFAMLKLYADNMVAHRQNVFRVRSETIEIQKLKSGELKFDFTRFDQIAELFWNTGKMDYLETGEVFTFGEKKWHSTEIFHKDFSIKDLETGNMIIISGEEVLPHLLPAIEGHLRMKGWLHKTLFHVKDEPTLHNAISWIEASKYVHRYAPDLIRIDAIETTYVLDDIEIAIPKLDEFATWYNQFTGGCPNDMEFWFYTVGVHQGGVLPNKTIDKPLIDSRIMQWLNYKYDAVGYLHWGWNAWTEDPYKEVGRHLGDGWQVYPTKDGVLNSLRWEQMRNGIQDYECFLLLEKKISELKDSLGTKFSWIDPKHKSKEIIGGVIKGFYEYSKDPELFYTAKKEVIEDIMEFNNSPRMYVQTIPISGSSIVSGSSVELYGWVEPETKILVNNIELPVDKQGLFLGKIELNVDSNIRIEASSDKGIKEISKKFTFK